MTATIAADVDALTAIARLSIRKCFDLEKEILKEELGIEEEAN